MPTVNENEIFYRVNSGYTQYNAKQLADEGDKVFTALTNNVAIFATPVPALTVLSGHIDALREAVNEYEAAGGGEVLRLKRDGLMQPVSSTLMELATYVQTISKGDKTVIVMGGFTAEKDRTSVGELSAPANFNVETKRGGIIELSWKKVKGANSYIAEWTPYPVTDASVWTPETSTKTKMGLSNFDPGQHLAFRVRAVGANPAKNYSLVVTDYTR